MGLNAAQLMAKPKLLDEIREQCRVMLAGYNSNPRLGAVFATQQRWLLAQAALAVFYDRDAEDQGIGLTRFLEVVRKYAIASRNTADAFLKEAVYYGMVESLATGHDRRLRPMQPSQEARQAIQGWALLHLLTLDRLDGGGRTARFLAVDNGTDRLVPAIAYRLLSSQAIRQPQKTFSLFTWLNNGGVIMDWLISGISDPEPGCDRIVTQVMDINDLAKWLRLSRTHLTRKLREAEAMGSLGWEGAKRHSAMWVSRGFLDEILLAQANKLAAIDAAFDETLGSIQPDPATVWQDNRLNPPNKSQEPYIDPSAIWQYLSTVQPGKAAEPSDRSERCSAAETMSSR